METYNYKEGRRTVKVALYKTNYRSKNNLAILMYDVKEKCIYDTLTVNIPCYVLYPDCAFVDINNLPKALKFIKDNDLGTKTGRLGFSGFCAYPEVRFNLEKIKDIKELKE